MRLYLLLVLVLLLQTAGSQWTAPFPSDEMVRQININYSKYNYTYITVEPPMYGNPKVIVH